MSAKTLIDFSNIGFENDQIARDEAQVNDEQKEPDDMEEEIVF